jgi:hypothetical protein
VPSGVASSSISIAALAGTANSASIAASLTSARDSRRLPPCAASGRFIVAAAGNARMVPLAV